MPSLQAGRRHRPLAAQPLGEGAGAAPHAPWPRRDPPRSPVSAGLGSAPTGAADEPGHWAHWGLPRPAACLMSARPSTVCRPSSPCSSFRRLPGCALQKSTWWGWTLRVPLPSGSPSWHPWSPTRGSRAPHTSRMFVSSSSTSPGRGSGENGLRHQAGGRVRARDRGGHGHGIRATVCVRGPPPKPEQAVGRVEHRPQPSLDAGSALC